MATIQFPRKGTGALGAAPIAGARVIDVTVDMANDVTVGTTDDLVVADLPAGTVVIAAGIEQIVAGAAGNTLAPRIGTQAVGGTLASDAAVGTLTTATSDEVPRIVPAAGATLNVLSAAGSRVTGKIRVFAIVVEGTKNPNTATAVARDTSTL
jgi:hypothetical protein